MNTTRPAGTASGPALASAPASPATRPKRPLALSTLLSLLTLAVLTPFLLLAAYALHAWVQGERAAEIDRIEAIAEDLAHAVDRELRGHIETAEVLAGSRFLPKGLLHTFWEHAEDAASRAGGHFILIDRSYQQLVNTRVAIGSQLPRTGKREGIDKVFRTGATVVGDLGVGAVAEEPLSPLLIPISFDGEVHYVLAHVPRTNAFLEVVQDTYRPEGWFAGLIDGNGSIIARSHRHEDFLGQRITTEVWARVEGDRGLLETVDLEGRPSITAYHASASSGWIVFVWAPRALLEEPAGNARRLLLLLVVLALATSLLAAFATGRLIRQPNARLLQAARDLGAGDPVAFSPSMMREANVVGDALVEAARSIRTRETALQESEAHMRLMTNELSHRSKNLLAIVQAIIGLSLPLSRDFAHFQKRTEERIAGLARSHDLLVRTDWRSVALRELITAQLSTFIDPKDRRLVLEGPALLIKPAAVQDLGMALHELAANAIHHGGLATPSGRVQIKWTCRTDHGDQEEVVLRWEEQSGPVVIAPPRNSFGFMVIQKVAPIGLGGKARLDWRPGGLIWELQVPASRLL